MALFERKVFELLKNYTIDGLLVSSEATAQDVEMWHSLTINLAAVGEEPTVEKARAFLTSIVAAAAHLKDGSGATDMCRTLSFEAVRSMGAVTAKVPMAWGDVRSKSPLALELHHMRHGALMAAGKSGAWLRGANNARALSRAADFSDVEHLGSGARGWVVCYNAVDAAAGVAAVQEAGWTAPLTAVVVAGGMRLGIDARGPFAFEDE